MPQTSCAWQYGARSLVGDDDVAFMRKALERLYSAVTKSHEQGIEGLRAAVAYAAMALSAKTEPDDSDRLLTLGTQLLAGALAENEATVLRVNCELSDECNLYIFVTADDVIAAVLDNHIDAKRWGEA